MSEELKNSPIEDFDWDAFEKAKLKERNLARNWYTPTTESLNTIKDKDVTEGTVIALNKREVVVNIGYKSDGIIPLNEFPL